MEYGSYINFGGFRWFIRETVIKHTHKLQTDHMCSLTIYEI